MRRVAHPAQRALENTTHQPIGETKTRRAGTLCHDGWLWGKKLAVWDRGRNCGGQEKRDGRSATGGEKEKLDSSLVIWPHLLNTNGYNLGEGPPDGAY